MSSARRWCRGLPMPTDTKPAAVDIVPEMRRLGLARLAVLFIEATVPIWVHVLMGSCAPTAGSPSPRCTSTHVALTLALRLAQSSNCSAVMSRLGKVR
jgi:hypothetical protein